jgi:hypothetical protein
MGQILERYRDVDFEQMKKVEGALIQALLPFKATTDPLLAVLALVRVIRVFLRGAPKPAQKEILPVLIAYLEGRTQLPRTSEESGKLWLPN